MADSKINIEIDITDDGSAKLKKLTGAVEDFESASKKGFGVAAASYASFIGNLGSDAVVGAFNFMKNAAGELFQLFAVDGVKAAIETQNSMRELESALRASGQASQDNISKFEKFASAIQATTKFGDDEVLAAGALIERMTQLKGDALPGATQAALDLAAAFNKDLTTASRLVGQAAEGNVTALKKLGIQVVKGKDEAATFANALTAIKNAADGAAVAAGETFSGRITILANAFEDAKKSVGNAIITNQSLINVLKVINGAVQELQQYIAKNQDSIQKWISEGVLVAITGLEGLVAAVQLTVEWFYTLEKGALRVQQAYEALKSGRLNEATDEIGKSIDALSDKQKRLNSGDSPFEAIRQQIYQMRDAVVEGIGKTSDQLNKQRDAAKGAGVAVEKLSEAQQKLIEKGVELAKQSAEKADPQIEFENRQAALEAAINAELISNQVFNDALVQITKERNDKVSALETANADVIIARNQELSQQNLFNNEEEIQSNQAKLKRILDNENLSAKDRQKVQAAYSQQSQQIEQGRAEAIGASLNALASLQSAKTKEIAAVGKAAAIAQATIDTYKGASAAASAVAGIPFIGPALAVAVTAAFVAAGLFRVAQIAGVPLKDGITEVPAGFSNDTFSARLSSGERVVTAKQNKDLTSYLSGANGQTELLSAILNRLNSLENMVTVNIGGKAIFEEVRSSLDQGRVFSV